jgi:hypothetical protein
MPRLSEEQRKAYVAKGGVRCPYCGAEDISGGAYNGDAGYVTQEVSCVDCAEEWQEVYTLSDVD